MMESLPIHSVPSSVLSCSMLAVYNLRYHYYPLTIFWGGRGGKEGLIQISFNLGHH